MVAALSANAEDSDTCRAGIYIHGPQGSQTPSFPSDPLIQHDTVYKSQP